jgi:hypothetical protein
MKQIIFGALALSVYIHSAAPVCAQSINHPPPSNADSGDAELSKMKQEIALREADLNKKKQQYAALMKRKEIAAAPSPSSITRQTWKGAFETYQKRWIAELGLKYDQEETQPLNTPQVDPCHPQQLFIRADSLDNYLYGITPANKAVGASVSYLNDQVGHTQTVGINGMVSYVAWRDLCPVTPEGNAPFISGYAIAPYVSGHGSLTIPRSKKEESTAKMGVEAAVEISRGWPLRQVFTFAPYYLTDYRGEARAQGFNAYWDSYDSRIHLGGYIDTDPYLGWFIQIRGETDVRNVDAVGVTGLDKGRYAWIGGTARASFFLFPNTTDVAPAFRNRISFIAEYNWYEDLQSRNTITKYKAIAKYNVSEAGNSSVQVEYTRGTDKDSLIYLNQVLLKLAYAF